jgi:hypothetical protein
MFTRTRRNVTLHVGYTTCRVIILYDMVIAFHTFSVQIHNNVTISNSTVHNYLIGYSVKDLRLLG